MKDCCEKCQPWEIKTRACPCECHTNHQNEAEWAEFDKRFASVWLYDAGPSFGLASYTTCGEDIKAFIKERFLSRAQIAEAVEGMKKEWLTNHNADCTCVPDVIVSTHNAALEALKAKLLAHTKTND